MVQCVSEVDGWLSDNMLKNNIDKLVCTYLSPPFASAKPLPTPLVFGETTIEPSRSARNLGVLFDEHLSMEQHVSTTARRAFYLLRCVSKVRKFVYNATCNALVCTLVFPYLNYCNSLLAGATSSVLNRLQRVQNAAARLVIRRTRLDRSGPLLRSLHWLPIRERIDHKIATLTFKAMNDMAPGYLKELLELRQLRPGLRNENRKLLISSRIRRERFGARIFSKAAPKLWNSLYDNVRFANTLPEFLRLLKTHLFDKAFRQNIV